MNDLRFAFRQLLKNFGFTAVAMLTLALASGERSVVQCGQQRVVPAAAVSRAGAVGDVVGGQSGRAHRFESFRRAVIAADGRTEHEDRAAGVVGCGGRRAVDRLRERGEPDARSRRLAAERNRAAARARCGTLARDAAVADAKAFCSRCSAALFVVDLA